MTSSPVSSPLPQDYEAMISDILASPFRSLIITFVVTLPVPTTYDVAITGDLQALGKWDISSPLFLKRKSSLEYTGRVRILISEEAIKGFPFHKSNDVASNAHVSNSTSTSSSSPSSSPSSSQSPSTSNSTQNHDVDPNNEEQQLGLEKKSDENIPTMILDHELLQFLISTDFIIKYKYLTLLDGAPMSWETSNRKICVKWWLKDQCTCVQNDPPELKLDESKKKVTSSLFVPDKRSPNVGLLTQNDGLFGSAVIKKYGNAVPNLFKPVDSEWIFNHVQLRIYQPTNVSPRLDDESVVLRVAGKRTRLAVVDTDTYVITAPTLDDLAFHVDIADPDNPGSVRSMAFVTHDMLQRKDVGEICAPIIEKKTFRVVGHFRALFLLVKPFKHPENNLRRVRRTLNWQQQSQMKNPEKSKTTKFIGHRGLGKSASSKNRALIEENSMLSFQRSAAVGVDYIEFDVQLTKDMQPVIFHDFLANIRVDDKTTIPIPVQDLTLQQLIDLGMRLKPSFDDANVKRLTKLMEQRTQKLKRSNSYDHLSTSCIGTEETKGKQSTWSISEAFVTLKDCFEKVPLHVGFNIEIKWPIESDIFNPNIPRNIFIDHILQCVFDAAGPRHILFSSFDPDVCTLLNLKQPKYPVFFLTEAGVATFPDHRCNSIPAAISFAKAIGLRGIVTDCTPIIKNPNWIQMVHEHDLMIATFGEANSLPKNIKIQQDMGIDAIICDNIDRVLKNRHKLDIDTQQILTGEPTRLSQWIETQDQTIAYDDNS